MLENISILKKSPDMLCGCPVYINPSLVVLDKPVQRRTHKSKRINKKWAKRYGFVQILKPDPKIYFVDGKIFGHLETIAKMLNFLKLSEGCHD